MQTVYLFARENMELFGLIIGLLAVVGLLNSIIGEHHIDSPFNFDFILEASMITGIMFCILACILGAGADDAFVFFLVGLCGIFPFVGLAVSCGLTRRAIGCLTKRLKG